MRFGDSFVARSPKVDRFLVCHLEEGELYSFFVHELALAMLWARFMRRRWQSPTWIELENAPAHRSGLRLELAGGMAPAEG